MPVRIISPVSGEVIQTNIVPQVVRVVAIADSNLNTDVRFKLNGSIAGIDTSATTINVNGTTEYQYQFNIPVSAAGIQLVEVEDINQSTVPVTVRSTAQVSFELKLNEPTITLAKTATTLAPNLVTATVANRPTGSSVRFTLNGNVIKQDNSVPFNVSVTESGELRADLIVDGVVRQTATLNVAPTPTPTPTPAPTPTPTSTPTPAPPLKGDKGEPGEQGPQGEPGIPGPKGDKGDTGDEGFPGVKGDAGIPGAVGEKGDVGDRGLPGEKGEKGDRGEKGETGATGAAGERGLPGERGITGDRGLPGANGERGLPGERGITGATGTTGAQGLTGERGLPGERGITGDRGLPGPKGDIGSIGLTGAVGAVGSKGDKGDKGDTGSIGLTGARGVAGADGAIGPRGVAGAVGERGATGDRGLQGVQGIQGAPGATGAQGTSAPVPTWSPWVVVPVIPSAQATFSPVREALLRYRKREGGLVQLLVDMALTSFDKSAVIAQIPPQNLSLWMAGYGFHHPITFWVPAVISAGHWLPAILTIDRAGTVQVQAPVTFSGTAGHLKLSCLIAETPQ